MYFWLKWVFRKSRVAKNELGKRTIAEIEALIKLIVPRYVRATPDVHCLVEDGVVGAVDWSINFLKSVGLPSTSR